MRAKRRCAMLWALVAALATVAGTSAAFAVDFPVRPIRAIVPYAAGGGSDITSRIVQEKAAAVLGQPLVIENRAGGGTLIGTQAVAGAEPDGYTLGVMDPAFVINPVLLPNVRYDPLKDFAAVTLITVTPLILVVPSSSPAKSVQELVDDAKTHPGKLDYGSPGSGSGGHQAIEQFRHAFGLQMVHVPYKGAGPAVTAVVAGEVPMLMAGSGATPFVQAGQLRALAVTGATRLPTLPDVPTFAELGFPQVDVQTFAGLVAPAGTPRPVVEKVRAAFAQSVQTAEVRARLTQMSQIVAGSTPEEFAAFLRSHVSRLSKVVRDANIKPDL